MKTWTTGATAVTLAGLAACSSPLDNRTQAPTAPTVAQVSHSDETPGLRREELDPIKHVVVIYMENHSFDNLYGEFPGANGISNGLATATQRDLAGTAYVTLPAVPGTTPFPATLPNAPFNIDQYAPTNVNTPDLVHRFYQEQSQIDGGMNDRFAAISDAKGLSMGYYHTAGLPLAAEAAKYTLCDAFFHSAFGGSFLNHMWLIGAKSPEWTGSASAIGTASNQLVPTSLNVNGSVNDGQVATIAGVPYLVNTVYSVNKPALNFTYNRPRVPNLTYATIGDRLSDKGISWAWYSGGWDNALAGNADPLFQFHHQPFAYFAKYADGTAAKAAHLRDESEFITLAGSKRGLPAVAFVKPIGELNEHPGYTNVVSGEQHAVDLINAIRNGPHWKHTVIVITYDENGGFWDHVAPPTIDAHGPGVRVPGLVISPFAKRGYVDHTTYETVSILALIEHRWGLLPLTDRDARANDLSGALDLRSLRASEDDDDETESHGGH
jgi:phospholipase C